MKPYELTKPKLSYFVIIFGCSKYLTLHADGGEK